MSAEALRTNEFQINPNFEDVTLFTSTFYGNDATSKLRQELALELFEHTDTVGVPIVVSDGGSNQDFLDQVATHPSVTLLREPEGSTMGESRRFALSKALEGTSDDPNHVFMWLEPEKVNLVNADTLTELVQSIRDGEADIVIPGRADKSTLPKQQAWFESRANHRATKLMRGESPEIVNDTYEDDLDLWFGPKVFNKAGAKYFAEYKGKLDKWDAVIAPVLEAHRGGLKVIDVPVNFIYPVSQSAYENNDRDFKRKRLIQYASILAQLGDPFWQTHKLRVGHIRAAESTSKPH